jgi:hypothetical protein
MNSLQSWQTLGEAIATALFSGRNPPLVPFNSTLSSGKHDELQVDLARQDTFLRWFGLNIPKGRSDNAGRAP